jgi:hypothetical protein
MRRKDYVLDGSTLIKCYAREAIDIPDSVTAIGDGVFSGCEKLSSINVGKQNQRFSDLDGVLFDKIKNLILCYPAGKQNTCYAVPDGIIVICDKAFFGCKNLVTIDIPGSVTAIGNNAFSGCKKLTSINVENQNPRFSDLDGVLFNKSENKILRYPAGKQNSRYAVPDGITVIGDRAFSGCKNLVTIDLADSVTAIGDGAFSCCRKLSSITVGKQNSRFFDLDGVLFDKSESRILRYPAGKYNLWYAIPAGISAIGDRAFSGCKNLVTIDIPDSVTAIGDFVFSGCKNLVTIDIPDSVTTIGDFAFCYCESLNAVYLSRKVSISEYAFSNRIKIFYTD